MVKVDAVEIAQHLRYLLFVFENGLGRLGNVIESRVTSECHCKCINDTHLKQFEIFKNSKVNFAFIQTTSNKALVSVHVELYFQNISIVLLKIM